MRMQRFSVGERLMFGWSRAPKRELLLSVFTAAIVTLMFTNFSLIPPFGFNGLTAAASASSSPFAASPVTISTLLARQLPMTSHIAYGRVLSNESEWNAAGTAIVTRHRLAVTVPVLGDLASEIDLYTDGGYIDAEGVGLWVSHSLQLTPNESLLLLLANEQDQSQQNRSLQNNYRIVGGEGGVFTLRGDQVVNELLHLQMPIEQFVQQVNLPQEQQAHAAATVSALHSAAEQDATQAAHAEPAEHHSPHAVPQWPTNVTEIAVKVHLNTNQLDDSTKPSGAFYMAIAQALRTWSVVEQADFTFLHSGATEATTTSYNGENQILFLSKGKNRPLGQAQIWYDSENTIQEVDMWLNDDYPFSVSGQPAFGEIDLESLVLHELGHWLTLPHDRDPRSVMFAALSPQQLKREVGESDAAKLAAAYPCAQMPCIHPEYQVALATPTPTFIATRKPRVATPVAEPTNTAAMSSPIYLPIVTR